MRVLVTRPQPGAGRTANLLRALGHDVLIVSLFEARHTPENLASAVPDNPSAIILTSAEALRSLQVVRSQLQPLLKCPVFAVGAATGQAARDFGFEQVMPGASGGRDLARQIADQSASDPALTENLIYIAGTPRSPELEETLQQLDISCRVITVYSMHPRETARKELHDAMAHFSPDAILLYSTETARHFLDLVSAPSGYNIQEGTRLLCLSRNIAAVIPQSLEKQVEISLNADEKSLIGLLSQA